MDANALLDLLQWPAMLATLIAAWLTASQDRHKRNLGFWSFLLSNVLWIIWGWHDGSYAVAVLQLGLAALNIRGVYKTE
jgi:hypothetical protein